MKISFDPGDTIKKIKNTTVDGLKGKCVEYRTVRGATHADYEVCFNLRMELRSICAKKRCLAHARLGVD